MFAAHMARARLRDRHQENLRKKLELLKAEQGMTTSAADETEPRAGQASSAQEPAPGPSTQSEPALPKQEHDEESEESGSEDEEGGAPQDGAAREMLKESFADYESGGYSPKYLTQSQLEPGTLIVSEEDDMQRLEFARAQILRGVGGRVEVSSWRMKGECGFKK